MHRNGIEQCQQQGGLAINVTYDRSTASRFGLTPSAIDNTLYDAFGQRQVSTIYNPLNQYHVVMEVAPKYWQDPDVLRNVYVSTSGATASGTSTTNAVAGTVAPPTSATAASAAATNAASLASDSARNAASNSIASSGKSSASSGAPVSTSVETMIPLAAFSTYAAGKAPLSVNHQNQFVAATISFNLRPGVSLGQASQIIDTTMSDLHVPATIQGHFSGTAQTFQQSLRNRRAPPHRSSARQI